MNKIYLDCGTWTGDSIKAFKKVKNDYDIYAFECEPRLVGHLNDLSQELDFTFINKAVWIKDGNISLYPGIDDLTQSSSIHFDKKKYIDKTNPITVKTINFSSWVLDNFNSDDHIICKMNIEGAEYDVLPKMMKDNSIDFISDLYIAWHWRKLKNITEEMHNNLLFKLKERTNVIRWTFEEGIKDDIF